MAAAQGFALDFATQANLVRLLRWTRVKIIIATLVEALPPGNPQEQVT